MADSESGHRTYLDGPYPSIDPEILADYRGDDDPAEAAAMLATAVQHWLCGPYDEYEYILIAAVERAAWYIVAQPCRCHENAADICDRCMAIGCAYGEHRTDACQQAGEPEGAR